MSKWQICCSDCFNLIAKRSPAAANLWIDLCEIQHTCNLFGIAMNDNAVLQVLEHMRFITTTDVEDMIVIKVHGQEVDGLGSFFCGGKCGR